MKIRTGFVSNSSSSSFCIVGYLVENIDKFDKELLDKLEDENDEFIVGYDENGIPEGKLAIGTEVEMDDEDNDFEIKDVDLTKSHELLEKLGIDPATKQLKMISGTKMT